MRRHMDNEVGPDQLVVVLDAQGASALQVTRKAQLCKDTALALNKVLNLATFRFTQAQLPLAKLVRQKGPDTAWPPCLLILRTAL